MLRSEVSRKVVNSCSRSAILVLGLLLRLLLSSLLMIDLIVDDKSDLGIVMRLAS